MLSGINYSKFPDNLIDEKANHNGCPFTADSPFQQTTYYIAGEFPANLGSDFLLTKNDYSFDASDTTNATITITSIRDTLVSGTFSAHLAPDMTITDGVFNNVPIKR